jgi:hypothetical protein
VTSAAVLPPLSQIDRERVKRGGLYTFMRLAWPHSNDPTPEFTPAKHLEVLSTELEKFARREKTRAIFNIPPSTGKSILTGVFYPAWVWTWDPRRRFMYVSYDVGILNEKTEQLLALLRSPWYVERWGERVTPGAGVSDFSTLQGGGRFNTSIKAKATGYHAHDQLIDDPINAKAAVAITRKAIDEANQTISNSLNSRYVEERTFGRMLIMQRLAEGDPSEFLAEQGWPVTRLPMEAELDNLDPLDWRTKEGEPLDPVRFGPESMATVKKEAKASGLETWATQYQQRPSVPGGAIVHVEWIEAHRVTVAEAMRAPGRMIQSWDLSFKDKESSDFVAGQWWKEAYLDGDAHYFLLDCFFDRLSFLETLGMIRAKRKLWRCGVIVIEDKANGSACESVLRNEFPGVIELFEPMGSKIARFTSTQVEWSEGRVHVVMNEHYDRIKDSYPKFPRVRRDDEMDATSQALTYFKRDGGYLGQLRGPKK